MPADYSRIHRLLKIITLIQSGGTWTAPRLAETCGVSERTIYRDLKMLEGAGIPYFFDEKQRTYRIPAEFFMPAVALTLDETLALIALGEHVGGKEQVPFTRAASRAIAKIRSQLPRSIREEVEQLEKHIEIDLAKASPGDGIGDVYEQMHAAIAARRALRCRYEAVHSSADDAAATDDFLFEPYVLFFSQRAWYVIGRHGGRGETRCLKLNRFAAIEPADARYDIPADFSVSQYLGNAWRMIPSDRSYDVVIDFDAAFAETIADTHWHDTQQIAWNEDGSMTFRCTVDGLDEIVWWVLSMGPHCTVRQPRELVEKVRQRAEAMVTMYRDSTGSE